MNKFLSNGLRLFSIAALALIAAACLGGKEEIDWAARLVSAGMTKKDAERAAPVFGYTLKVLRNHDEAAAKQLLALSLATATQAPRAIQNVKGRIVLSPSLITEDQLYSNAVDLAYAVYLGSAPAAVEISEAAVDKDIALVGKRVTFAGWARDSDPSQTAWTLIHKRETQNASAFEIGKRIALVSALGEQMKTQKSVNFSLGPVFAEILLGGVLTPKQLPEIRLECDSAIDQLNNLNMPEGTSTMRNQLSKIKKLAESFPK